MKCVLHEGFNVEGFIRDVCKYVTLISTIIMCENREKVNKGIGIENVHYLNDGLWHMKTYK